MKWKNTLQKGQVRFIIFREKGTWYGIALAFNIIETGDTPQEVMLLLFEAIRGYLEAARKVKARPHILNQKTDPEYERMWESLEAKKKILNKQIFSFGNLNLSRDALIAA